MLATGDFTERDAAAYQGFDPGAYSDVDILFLTAATNDGFEDELNWHYNHYETRSLEDAFGPEFARLDDQPAGSNREGFLGLYEYRQLRDHRYADTIESEKGDEPIVEAYADYDANNRKRVILLSNDYGFVERARDADILAQHVSFRRYPGEGLCDVDELHSLLQFLAVLFGVLELPKVTADGV